MHPTPTPTTTQAACMLLHKEPQLLHILSPFLVLKYVHTHLRSCTRAHTCAQVLSAVQSKGYLWVLSLNLANWGHHAKSTSIAVMTCLVSKFLGRMTASSSPGFEDFSAPFLKYAYPGDEKNKNVIVPYLAYLFHVALSEKRIPACWKNAKISPLYKKGSKLDPNNYRMLAVSGTLYRLYTNILRELVTK